MSKERDARQATSTDGLDPVGAGSCPDSMALAAYLDGGMDRQEREVLEAHLAACRKCARDVEELRELLANLTEDPEHAPLVRDVAERAKKLLGD